nr:NADH dehydrogenase subunit 2 [Strongylocotes lipogonus]
MGVSVVVCSTSMFLMWAGIEISSMFFIPLVSSVSMECWGSSSWKYFMVQSLSSFLLLFSVVVNELTTFLDELVLAISLLMKVGFFPFTGWVLSMSENMDWVSFYLIGTVQKIAPLSMVSKLGFEDSIISSFFLALVVISSFFLSVVSVSKISTRWMMVLSSTYNVNWLVVSALMGLSTFSLYILLYSMALLLAIATLSSLSGSESLFSSLKPSNSSVLSSFPLVMVMGIPPVGVFPAKLEVLVEVLAVSKGVGAVLLFSSAVFMVMYVRFFVKMYMVTMKWDFVGWGVKVSYFVFLTLVTNILSLVVINL